jgi:hypothetical protein
MTSAGILVSIIAAVLAASSLAAALHALRALGRSRVRQEALEENLAALRREMELMASISVRTGRQVKRIEHDYSGVADRVEAVEQRGAAQSLDQAIDWARRGADASKLIQLFGFSRGEADLMTRLHGGKKSA